MTILEILQHPDKRLKKISQPIMEITPEIKKLSQDMLETMYDSSGVGLAAPQINQLIRLIVIDTSENSDNSIVMINPKIVKQENIEKSQEGCLSIPGYYENIERAKDIVVEYQDLDNSKQSLATDGLLSVCIQHEIDHLDGVLFVDYLSKLKQTRLLKKIKKNT